MLRVAFEPLLFPQEVFSFPHLLQVVSFQLELAAFYFQRQHQQGAFAFQRQHQQGAFSFQRQHQQGAFSFQRLHQGVFSFKRQYQQGAFTFRYLHQVVAFLLSQVFLRFLSKTRCVCQAWIATPHSS